MKKMLLLSLLLSQMAVFSAFSLEEKTIKSDCDEYFIKNKSFLDDCKYLQNEDGSFKKGVDYEIALAYYYI